MYRLPSQGSLQDGGLSHVTIPSSAPQPPNRPTGHHRVKNTRKGRSGVRFPTTLHRLMGTSDAKRLIYWNLEGNVVIIPDPEALEAAEILSQYFNHNSFDTVVRQFHYYGFDKANRAQGGETYHVYYHRHFLRDHPELLDEMKPISQGRESVKDRLVRAEERIEELEDENKTLEDENKMLEEKNKTLEEKNKTLEDEKKGLKEENSRLTEFLNFVLEPLYRATSTMWSTQPSGNQHVSHDPQPLANTMQNTPHPSGPTCQFLFGQPSFPAISTNYYHGSSVPGYPQSANSAPTSHMSSTVAYVSTPYQATGGYQM